MKRDLGSIPRNIRIARAKANITQAELAKKAHVALSTIYLAESGKRVPNVTTLAKICKALDVDFETMVN